MGFAAAGAMAAVLLTIGGCVRETPPPPRVPVPATSNRDAIRDRDYVKPIPPEDDRIDLRVDRREVERVPGPAPRSESAREPSDVPPAPPPVRESVPPPAPPPARAAEMPADAAARVHKDFVDAYRQVGQPHMVVFVNRTFDGRLITDPAAPDDRARTEAPLRHDQYDTAAVHHAIDLATVESRLAEQMSCDKQVMVLPPATVHEKLGDAHATDLEAGKASVLATIDQSLNADVLIQVQVQPMKVSGSTMELRLVAEAVNVRGGQVIGHALADIDHPQDADQINGATQYISRKLMIDMLRAWTAPAPADAPPPPAPRP